MAPQRPNKDKPRALHEWILDHLELGDLSGVRWLDSLTGIFSIEWPHKASRHWYLESNNIFRAWQLHRGRSNSDDYRKLKQILRCALHGSRRRILYRRDISRSTGSGAYRVYQFVNEPTDLESNSSSVPNSPPGDSVDFDAFDSFSSSADDSEGVPELPLASPDLPLGFDSPDDGGDELAALQMADVADVDENFDGKDGDPSMFKGLLQDGDPFMYKGLLQDGDPYLPQGEYPYLANGTGNFLNY